MAMVAAVLTGVPFWDSRFDPQLARARERRGSAMVAAVLIFGVPFWDSDFWSPCPPSCRFVLLYRRPMMSLNWFGVRLRLPIAFSSIQSSTASHARATGDSWQMARGLFASSPQPRTRARPATLEKSQNGTIPIPPASHAPPRQTRVKHPVDCQQTVAG
jgi:hypothetical protein